MKIDLMMAELLFRMLPGVPPADASFWESISQMVLTIGNEELLNSSCSKSNLRLGHSGIKGLYLFVPSGASSEGLQLFENGSYTIGSYLWEEKLRPSFIYGAEVVDWGCKLTFKVYCMVGFDYDAYFAGQIDSRRDQLLSLAEQALESYRQLIEKAANELKHEYLPDLEQKRPPRAPRPPSQKAPAKRSTGGPYCCHCGKQMPTTSRLSRWNWACSNCNGKRIKLGSPRFCRQCGTSFIPGREGSIKSQTFKRTCPACSRPR